MCETGSLPLARVARPVPREQAKGRVTMAQIDTALTRLLHARMAMGLFDDPDSIVRPALPRGGGGGGGAGTRDVAWSFCPRYFPA